MCGLQGGGKRAESQNERLTAQTCFAFPFSDCKMLDQRKINAYLLLSIVASNCLLLTYAYPQQEVYQRQLQQQQQQQLTQSQSPVYRPESSGRKFAVKPNASKKVALDDIEDDIEGNQIQESVGGPGGFTWSNMLSTVMTMFFNGAANAPTKSDDVDGPIGLGGSPWANVISMGECGKEGSSAKVLI